MRSATRTRYYVQCSLDDKVEAFILSKGATSAFKGYRGYPATVCTSINEEVVHGIPSPKRKLKEGDIIGLDLGCIVEEAEPDYAGVDEAFKTAQRQDYLRPISDASGGGHYYCELSPRFRWREEWDGAKLRAILSRTLPAMMTPGGGGLQRIIDIEVTRTTPSGRVGELRIAFEHGDVRVPGPDVRAVLRPQADQILGSTSFALSVTKDGGQVTRLIAAGAGWGHGVGFCQWGAVGRARAGQDYRTIVTTYFPGTNVQRLY